MNVSTLLFVVFAAAWALSIYYQDRVYRNPDTSVGSAYSVITLRGGIQFIVVDYTCYSYQWPQSGWQFAHVARGEDEELIQLPPNPRTGDVWYLAMTQPEIANPRANIDRLLFSFIPILPEWGSYRPAFAEPPEPRFQWASPAYTQYYLVLPFWTLMLATGSLPVGRLVLRSLRQRSHSASGFTVVGSGTSQER